MRVLAPLTVPLAVLAFTVGCGGGGGESEGSGQIAFTVNDRGWSEIWLMASDGSERRRLTEVEPADSDAAGSTSPAWSPDGTQLAFAARIGREEDPRLTELYVMRADGTDRRRLTKNHALDGLPTWSPDGERIAFTRIAEPGTASAGSGIVVIDVESGREEQITDVALPSFDLSPAWSPDGSEIVFTRGAPSGGSVHPSTALYLIRPDGSGLRKLADDGSEPAWSPDGSRISFTSYRDSFGQTCFHECSTSGEIYVLDVGSGGEVERLTRSRANDSSPAWSADGASIAFVSDRSNPSDHENEIYVMTTTGRDPRRITENKVWDLEPAWQP
jgi:Tol biopolymer transport system component